MNPVRTMRAAPARFAAPTAPAPRARASSGVYNVADVLTREVEYQRERAEKLERENLILKRELEIQGREP